MMMDGEERVEISFDLRGNVPFVELFITEVAESISNQSPGFQLEGFLSLPRGKWIDIDELVEIGGASLEQFKSAAPQLWQFSFSRPNRSKGAGSFKISKEKVLELKAIIEKEDLMSDQLKSIISGL
ncbi:hypothetical protein A7D35_07740 [Xanthomonas arboricola]|nr:hypothetical protein A7D35_07740 [Xanthomonas arboricola]